MVMLPKHYWTEAEYLAFERSSLTKHEYFDGEIYDMVGGSARHSQIAANAIVAFSTLLRGRPCRVYTSDLGVKLARAHVYPDVTVVCGAPRFLDDKEDRLLNPTLILEVLSPSTEAHDRGKKLERYQALESLQACLLAAQDEPQLELYTRHAEGWLYTRHIGLEAVAEIPLLGIGLALAALYSDVTFPAAHE